MTSLVKGSTYFLCNLRSLRVAEVKNLETMNINNIKDC